MPQIDRRSLWTALRSSGALAGRFIAAREAEISLSALVGGSSLAGRARELEGRSVLLAASDQLRAGLALIELDGIARQVVLCPPDLPVELVPFIVDTVGVDSIVSDRTDLGALRSNVQSLVACSTTIVADDYDRSPRYQTEWILLTSGTTGQPKMVVHTLPRLTGAIQDRDILADGFVWSTFYDIRRYGGLQIFLRAVVTGGSLLLSSPDEPTEEFLNRVGGRAVSHISGTPSHWRKALMSPCAHQISPQYVRLSGEIADQAVLDNLRSCYPQARISHAFASTEAGVVFDVRDGLAGFPASFVNSAAGDVEVKVENGSLRIRSSRTALCYIGRQDRTVADAEGFVDTGDMVDLRGDRYYFVGRRDGVINIGGLKVHPEEVECVINRHPRVRMSLVRTRKSPITGAIVVADVVLRSPELDRTVRQIEQEIIQLCQGSLPRHKVPATVSFRSELPVAATGKLVRQRA